MIIKETRLSQLSDGTRELVFRSAHFITFQCVIIQMLCSEIIPAMRAFVKLRYYKPLHHASSIISIRELSAHKEADLEPKVLDLEPQN